MNHPICTLLASLFLWDSAMAAVVLDSGFESNGLTAWHIVVSDRSSPVKTAPQLRGGFDNYIAGDFADLGKRRLVLNTSPTRSVTLTAMVFETDGVTRQLATAKTWTFTAALGQRIDEGNTTYDDSSSVNMRIGYLAAEGDLSSFVAIEEAKFPAAVIAEIGKGNYQDFFVSTRIAANDVAYGRPLAIQLYAYSPQSGYGGQTSLQASVDNIRVVSTAPYASIPEPSSYVTWTGLFVFCLVITARPCRRNELVNLLN